MADFVSGALNLDGWLNQAKEVFSDQALTQNRYTPSLKSAFKELTRCYKEHILSWWEIQSFESYIKENIVPRGLRVTLTPSNRLRNQELMKKWEKEATDSSLRFMRLLLEEEKNNLEKAKNKLKEQIEVTVKFKQDADYKPKEIQLQNVIERFQFNLKERKHAQFVRDLQDFRDNCAYTLLERRDRREQETDLSSSDTDCRDSDNPGKRGKGKYARGYNRGRGSNRNRGSFPPKGGRKYSPPRASTYPPEPTDDFLEQERQGKTYPLRSKQQK